MGIGRQEDSIEPFHIFLTCQGWKITGGISKNHDGWMLVNVIGHTCAFPALTCENVCHVKGPQELMIRDR